MHIPGVALCEEWWQAFMHLWVTTPLSILMVMAMGILAGSIVKSITGFGSAIAHLSIWSVAKACGVNAGTLQQAIVTEIVFRTVTAVPYLRLTNARQTANMQLVVSISLFQTIGSPLGAWLLLKLSQQVLELCMAAALGLVILGQVVSDVMQNQRRRPSLITTNALSSGVTRDSSSDETATLKQPLLASSSPSPPSLLTPSTPRVSTASVTAGSEPTSARPSEAPAALSPAEPKLQHTCCHVTSTCTSPVPAPLHAPSKVQQAAGRLLVVATALQDPLHTAPVSTLPTAGTVTRGSISVESPTKAENSETHHESRPGGTVSNLLPADVILLNDDSRAQDLLHEAPGCEGCRASSVERGSDTENTSPASAETFPYDTVVSVTTTSPSAKSQRVMASKWYRNKAELTSSTDTFISVRSSSSDMLGVKGIRENFQGDSSISQPGACHSLPCCEDLEHKGGSCASDKARQGSVHWVVEAEAADGKGRCRQWVFLLVAGSLAGTLSGLMGGLTAVDGPPTIFLFNLLRADKATVRGTNAVINCILMAVLVTAYGVEGVFVWTDLPLYVTGIVFGWIGTIWGDTITHKIPQEVFVRLLNLLVVLCAALMLSSGLGLAGF